MIVRPKLIIDTNVLINAADGTISPKEWRRATNRIRHDFRCCVSFTTMKELFVGLARCADAYFERNKEPLRLLYNLGKRRFLPYPSVFVLREVLGFSSLSRTSETHDLSDEEWGKTVIRAVLGAPSKAQLKDGIPIRNGRRRKFQFFDLNDFDQHENAPQIEHADLLQGIREGRIDQPDALKWTAWILHQHGLPPYTEHCEKLAVALDAAYRFSVKLSEMARDKGYNFHKHATDWGDATQLFYLCDPHMRFLTTDENCRNHTARSSQSHQILLWREFLASTS